MTVGQRRDSSERELRRRPGGRREALLPVIALSGLLGLVAVTFVGATWLRARRAVATFRAHAPVEGAERRVEVEIPPGPRLALSVPSPIPYATLPALTFVYGNAGATGTLRLYDDEGALDEAGIGALETTLADVSALGHPAVAPLDRRLLRVLVRAAQHFGATTVRVVSAYRAPRRRAEGLHAKGRAIDFGLDGVPPREVAAYLRERPRLGVGVYVHRRTQYVHLDVRELSFHWIDGSPPHTGGWPASLGTRGLEALDATWTPESDLPERTR